MTTFRHVTLFIAVMAADRSVDMMAEEELVVVQAEDLVAVEVVVARWQPR